MANYTHFNVANLPPMDWIDAMGLAYGYNASLVTVLNYDNTLTKAHGAFVIFNGQLIGGAITSLERTSADGATVYESITGLSYSISTFLNASAKDRIPGVLGGADTLNGTSGPDELDGFAGPDALKGGGGDDVYIVGAGDTVTENFNAGDRHGPHHAEPVHARRQRREPDRRGPSTDPRHRQRSRQYAPGLQRLDAGRPRRRRPICTATATSTR